MFCRNCKTPLKHIILDLGTSPPANAFLSKEDLNKPELWYPLRLLLCDQCFLVQTEDFIGRESLFKSDYVYLSSYSDTWLEHSKRYVEMAEKRFKLGRSSLVVEVASNDGYLLQYVKEREIPCYGVEPTHIAAEVARKRGIETIEEFFGSELAKKLSQQRGRADLIIANNVLAHVPDINDFVSGVYVLLKPEGVATFEFQYVVPLIEQGLFDTVYHEHYSYLSFTVVYEIMKKKGLEVFDVEKLQTHGGSLRVYVQRIDEGKWRVSENVYNLLKSESELGVCSVRFYEGFQAKAEKIKYDFLQFLIDAKNKGKRIVAYGAAAKGNTLLNFAGVRSDLIEFVVDRNPIKQGKFLPGSRIPVVGLNNLQENKYDYVIILPWNLKDEILGQHRNLFNYGVNFVFALPYLKIL
ncbi:MAG: class I SAM-dependent methyltransferase [Thermodesulfovibrio sp.]|nr:class I SAM-dependent methyltransferase [Thermodesulfovibrio sp.]